MEIGKECYSLGNTETFTNEHVPVPRWHRNVQIRARVEILFGDALFRNLATIFSKKTECKKQSTKKKIEEIERNAILWDWIGPL